jgi:hypothetical protein
VVAYRAWAGRRHGAIDALLDELSRPGPLDNSLFTPRTGDAQQQQAEQQRAAEQFNALQSQNAQLRGAIQAAADRQDFDKLTSELQGRLPQHLPDDFARTQLLAMAVQNPDLVAAYDYRHVDRKAVDTELRRVEQVFNQTTDPAQRAALEQYGRRLGLALNAPEIIRRATREVVKRAEAHKLIDEQATADHDAVAAAVRGASGKAQPEPPPNFGNMSDKQLARYTKEHFGF